MKKYDARKLPKEVQQHSRNQAIRLFQKGITRKQIAEIVGVHYSSICKWIRIWKSGGKRAIKLKKRGRGSENQRLLTIDQEKAPQKIADR